MTTYILIDASGQATVIPENRIYEEAGRRFINGETFEIYRAEPMTLAQAAEGAAPQRRGKAARKRAGKATRRTGRRAAAAAAGAGRVGRPKVNVGPCMVPGCGKPQKTRGLCSAHYQQHRRLVRQGQPGLLESLGITPPEEEAPAKPSRKGGRRKAKAAKASRPARKKAARKGGRRKAKAAKKAKVSRKGRKKTATKPAEEAKAAE